MTSNLNLGAALGAVAALTLAACGATQSGTEPAQAQAKELACAASSDPRVTAMSDAGIASASALGLPSGRYALPATGAPTQLVVMFHGHGNDSCSWRNHLRHAAERGAVAVAMDYTGQRREGDVEHYGWFVKEGAADSIQAAKYFLKRYPSITQVFAFGVSMGGNAAGMAVASPDAVRADGTPLFDYLVDIEGVNNLIEEYSIIVALAPVNAGAELAKREIEEEAGGTPDQVPDAYIELTNVARFYDMYLRGAVIVHAFDDGLVSPSQSPEFAAALNSIDIPTHTYSVVLRGEGESGGTVTGIAADPLFAAAGQEYPAPLAGHGWEGSETHLSMITGLDALWALMAGGTVEPGETVVPGV